MQKINKAAIVIYICFAILNYIVEFYYVDSTAVTLNMMYLPVKIIFYLITILYIILSFILLFKKSLSILVKGTNCFVIIFVSFIFIFSHTNPIYAGIKRMNNKAGGNSALIAWANSIFQMPLVDIVGQENTEYQYSKINESFYEDLFKDIEIDRVFLFNQSDGKYLQIFYTTGRSVLIGNKELISTNYSINSLYKDGEIYLIYVPTR